MQEKDHSPIISEKAQCCSAPAFKIYTRRGDKGQTDLADGSRVYKTDLRIRCVGELDELSSQLGWVLSILPDECRESLSAESGMLVRVQRFLFAMGAWAAAVRSPKGLPDASDIAQMEEAINQMALEVGTAFNGFVLPGGHPAAASAHVARTICRRVERTLLEAGASEWHAAANQLAYINRLSDYLYILAKKINKLTNFIENKW